MLGSWLFVFSSCENIVVEKNYYFNIIIVEKYLDSMNSKPFTHQFICLTKIQC